MIDQAALEHFEEHGYVVVRNVLDWDLDLVPVYDEYSTLLNELSAGWIDEGRLSSSYSELAFTKRIIKVVTEARRPYDQAFDISLPQAGVQYDTPIHNGQATFDLLRSPRLLDAVEKFIGPEIYSNPVQHTRMKLPENLLPEEARTGLTAQIAWHQDLGVILPEADKMDILTVWFPMTEADEENGCLAVVPGSHKQWLHTHCRSANDLILNQVCIPDKHVGENRVPLPMKPGDVLFMHRCTRHAGLENKSDRVRWSFDLRYQRIGEPTGRPWFPGFVARSEKSPESVLTSVEEWAQRWREARAILAANGTNVSFNRWTNSEPMCA